MRRTLPVTLLLLLACGPFFYQAPPNLGSYPQRVVAKRWQHLFAESLPLDTALPNADALDESCRKLPATLAPLDTKKRLALLDQLLTENRNGAYSARRANFLHELREVSADPALFTAMKTYIDWRAEHDTPLPPVPPEEKPWDMEPPEFEKMQAFYEFKSKQRFTFFKEQIEKATPLTMPYWKVRRAANIFDEAQYILAAVDFTSVVESFPDHPRTEVARLMLARCKIGQSRVLRHAEEADAKADEITTMLDEADGMLTDFMSRYPKSRFAADAEGWLGAIAFDKGLFGTAMQHQLARLDHQATREITRTVLRECDLIFEKLLESQSANPVDEWLDPQEEFDAAAVAKHPLVARLFVQHCIDPAAHISLPMWWDDSESGGRATIDFLKRRILNPKPFVSLALTELGKELVKTKSKPDATTLTLLAWAATEEGEHEQALALLDQTAPSTSDESLHARSIILQRLGRHQEALAAFDALSKNYPQSPLVNDLPYRKSLSLFKTGESGKAIIEILPLVYPNAKPTDAAESDAAPDGPPVLHPESQLIQWLDTLVQFSPLEQLEIACAATSEITQHRDLLADAIRARALASERFDLAARYLSPDAETPASDRTWPDNRLAPKRKMTRADWDERAAPLANLYTELEKNPPASAAEKLQLAIARHWLAQRGSLTIPSLSLCYYAGSEEEKQDLLRRKNALELGFSRDEIQRELDHRDEATLALDHALLASESSDPATAAPALELANACLFRRSEFSLYQKSRALETQATKLSAELYQKLRTRFPQSPEAKRAAYFTFTPPAGPWMPGDYNSWNSAAALSLALFGDFEEQQPPQENVTAEIAALATRFENYDAKTKIATIRKDLANAKSRLNELRALTDPTDQVEVVRVIDRLDDLHSAVSLPGIRTEDFSNYTNGHHGALPPAFKSLLDYRQRVTTVTDVDGNEVPSAQDTIPQWRAFLELYPNSPKAEAASLRLTRLIAREYRGSPRIRAFYFPAAPIPNGYKRVACDRPNPANDPKAVIAAIDDHEARFPNGRYHDDLSLLRAGALIDLGEFPEALVLVDQTLANPSQRDLHLVAALAFAEIAQNLLEPTKRQPIANSLRNSPGAMARLAMLVDGDTFLSRLKPLMPWLEGG
ncbi:MAG: tetratricopeptide repeat protein [Gloeobacteraceae cyanobacterium ES-bin-144]|nr:tetratricopeptide repeat protein [Verrucomicrobiales bacterium]